MSNAVEKYEYRPTPESRKVTIRIQVDEDVTSPRKEFDNVGTMVCSHRNYQLGDEQVMPEELQERYEQAVRAGHVILPLYFYDHSVQRMSTRSFVGRAQHAAWDSSCVGFIYVSRATAVAKWGKKICTPAVAAKAMQYLQGEVETYDRYLAGEIYEFTIKRKGKVLDSCCGCYGFDYVKEEAEACARALLAELPAKQPKQAA